MAANVTIEKDKGFEKTSDYCWVNIVVDRTRVGKARVHFWGTRFTIYSINIFPEFQRNGYARSVVKSVKREYKAIVADSVRDTAREFWTRMGFHADGNGNYSWKEDQETVKQLASIV
ncbi:MAG: GNAT family N-acetyltransferase [Phycisphaerae bacterium]|nr:GNAT family N-acetyltransferase [Phycisphaerae bacterium]